MTSSRSRAWIVLMGSMALAWSLVFSGGLKAPTGTTSLRAAIPVSTGALIPGAHVALQQPAARADRATVKSRQGLTSLPVAAQPVVSATLGQNDGGYEVGAVAGVLLAQNPAQSLRADFTAQGMEVRAGQAHWRLALNGYGYGDHLEKVGKAAPQSRGNRVEYQRGPLVEWYVNGPAGLEQGFTISEPPASKPSGHGIRDTGHGASNSSPLTIALQVGGDLAATADSPADGQGGTRAKALTLRDGRGQTVLRYTGLAAHDADGRTLVAWLELGQNELRLRVEDAGVRYPVVVDPFVQQAELTASDGAANDFFGRPVAVSSDGTTIVIGASQPPNPPSPSNGAGAAYVFVMPAGGWGTTSSFTAKLTASDGVSGDQFGYSVGVSADGSAIVAGAPYAQIGSNSYQGAAYVFVKPGGGWATTSTFTAKLTASDGGGDDYLGWSVGFSRDGSTIVAGAPQYADIGGAGPGAAFVFLRPGGGWANSNETAKLTASDGAYPDSLGFSIAVSSDGSTIVAGARLAGTHEQGAAYGFVKPGSGWASATYPQNETAKLTASDGATADFLGESVAVSGDGSTIVAGACDASGGSGKLYVFVMPGGGWGSSTQTAELTTLQDSWVLGYSVGMSSDGNTIVGGAPDTNIGSNINQGAAYVFIMPAGGWATTSTYNAKLTASDGTSSDNLGFYVAVSGDGLSIAATAPYRNSLQGAAYVFLTAPTVTFTGAPASEPYQGTFNVASTTNSSTSPVYTASGGCSNGGTTTYTMTSGTGQCYAIATWAADVNYTSARLVQRTTASKIAPTVTFAGAPASEPYQGTFTVTSATNSSRSPVYSSSGSCTNVGTLYTMTKGTGTCTAKVSWVTDANYLRASLTQTTTASKIGQTITFTTPAPTTAADHSTFPVAAQSTSGLKVSLSVAAGSVCSLGPRTTVSGVTTATVTMLKGTGTCTIDANQAGNNNYAAAAQQQTSAAATP